MEEIKGVSKIAKPVHQVLFKVSTLGPESLDPSVLGLLAFFFLPPFFLLPAASQCRFFASHLLLLFSLPFFLLPSFLLRCHLMKPLPLYLSQL